MPEPETRPAHLGRKLATGFFLVVIVGVPLIEASSGVWPGVGAGTGWGLRDLIRGKWGTAVERELGDRSAVADAVRPTYNAAMYQCFREVNPKIVLGDDEWLFLAATIRDYPPPGAPRLLRETVTLIRGLHDWFESQGTEFYVLVVPNKASVHPEKLSGLRPRFEPYYAAVHAEMLAHGLWTDDTLSELRPSQDGRPAYHAYDTHWTPESALRAVRQVERSVRERFAGREGGIPGTRVEGVVEAAAKREFVGGTVQMLGVGDRLGVRGRFVEVSQRLRGVDATTGAELGADDPQELVWVGTSFSEGYRVASIFSAGLGRVVEDRSLHGLGPTKALLDVVDGVRRGERSTPALVVWEFPERYFFKSPAQMQEPLRQVLQGILYDPESATPLAVSGRDVEGLELTTEQPGLLIGVSGSSNPLLSYRLQAPILADGSHALAFSVTASRLVAVRIYLDCGEGKPDSPQALGVVPKKDVAQRIVVPLEGPAPVQAVFIEIITQRRQRPGKPIDLRVDGPELWTR